VKVPDNWSQRRRDAVHYMLSKKYTYISSDESGDDSDVPESKVLINRPLKWLKDKYRRSLKALDKLHYISLSSKGKQMYMKRVVGEPSCRPQPQDIPLQLMVNDDTSANTGSTDTESTVTGSADTSIEE